MAERQQCLFSCLPHYMLIQSSLILIFGTLDLHIFFNTFLLCSPLLGSLFQAVTLLYCSCVHNSTAVIFMKESLAKQTSLAWAPQGPIKVLVILTIHVNALNFNYFHMQINSTCSLSL